MKKLADKKKAYQKRLAVGFISIFFIVMIGASYAFFSVKSLQNSVKEVATKKIDNIKIVNEMRILAREKTLDFYDILLTKDAFEIERIIHGMKERNAQFNDIKLKLKENIPTTDKGLYAKFIKYTNQNLAYSDKLINFIIANDFKSAESILFNGIIPLQKQSFEILDRIYYQEMTEIDKISLNVKRNEYKVLFIIGLAAISVIVIGVLIGYITVSNEKQSKQKLKEINLSLEDHVRKRTSELNDEKERISVILNSVHDGIISCNSNGIIETYNPGASHIFGYKYEEVIGKNICMLFNDQKNSKIDLSNENCNNHSYMMSIMSKIKKGIRKNGEIFYLDIRLNSMHLDGELKIIALMIDVTERVKKDEEIKRLAMSDPLTCLANRNQFNLNLRNAIKTYNRTKQNFGVMLIDLDKFKSINDTYGHPFGDSYLIKVGHILKESCREVDTIARLGGDEFAVIFHDVSSKKNIHPVVDRIINYIKEPIKVDDKSVLIGLSMGISFYGVDSLNEEELIKYADDALYQAKKVDGNHCCYYSNK